MSGVTLCMVVRNERDTLAASLGPLHDAVDAVLVLDDNSSDGTAEMLRQAWGITPLAAGPRGRRCLADLRNTLLARVRTPWVLWLDADEHLDPACVPGLLAHAAAAGHGLFLPWHTRLGERRVEDYKLVLARREARYRGLVHETVQPDFRSRGWHAELTDQAVLGHNPPLQRRAVKRHWYLRTLQRAIHREPHWRRYHWFLGYQLSRQGQPDNARPALQAAAAGHPLFPVEQLNAHLLLAAEAAGAADWANCRHWVQRARALHAHCADDFEVRANTRLGPWLDAATAALEDDRGAFPAPYAFAC